MQVSNSAKDRYQQCSMSYKMHYIDKIRPIRTSSALPFGSALDEALNILLVNKNLNEAINVFNTKWGEYKDNPIIDYFKSDLDMSLLTDVDIGKCEGELKEHLLNWTSLSKKGEKLLTAYHDELLPKIKNVISVQKNISIKSDTTDDEIIGIIDFIADIELPSGEVVTAVMDNKSSSSPYPKNAVLTKHQTALYTYAEGIEKAGFAVMNKKTFRTQLLIDTVPMDLQEQVINEFIEVLNGIKSGDFKKNEKSKCFFMGQKCPYYGYCWYGKKEGLCEKPREEINVDINPVDNVSRV